MIQPDAKCVVNGHKVNEVIDALNPLLNMDIIVGNVAQPQIQYSSGAVQIVIPPGGGASTNEELDIVDENNQASTRWFLTTTTQGSGGAAIASGTGTNIGSTGGKNNPAATKGDRDKLGGGIAGGPAGGKNRDNLDRAAAGGGGPIGGGNDGQGGAVGGPVQIDNPQDTGGARPGSAVAIGGRRAQPAAGEVAPEALPAAGEVAPEALPAAGEVAPEAIPIASQQSTPAPQPVTGSKKPWATGGGDNIPLTASGKIDLSKMTPEQKEKYGFTDNIPLTGREQKDGRKPGESNTDFLARLATGDPVKHGPTLKRQIEADMYRKAYDEAKKMSKNAGMPFDSNDFNAQWEHQAGRRKQLVDQEFNRLIGR